jgi:membrane protease YdiL (CAAX protease family)
VTQLLNLDRFSITLPILHDAMKRMSRESMLWALLVSAVLPGVGEELFFRGFIQTRLRQRWKPWTAIVVTSVLFGLLHGDPVHSPMAFFMGLVLGWLVERTGSLWVSMFAHAANNGLATLQAHGTTLPVSPANELALTMVVAVGAAALFVQQPGLVRPEMEAAVLPTQP